MNHRTIDVVVPVYRDVSLTEQCLDSVLRLSGPLLGRLIVVDDAAPEPGMRPMLEALREREGAVRLIRNEANLGFVGSCNRGLALAQGDVVILNSDTRVTPGWLDELAAALQSDPLVAAACPLSNNATLCSIPWGGSLDAVEGFEPAALGTAGIDRFTTMPTGVGFCMLMRGEALSLLGPFDPVYGRGYNEENDWCQRARAAGFTIVRANRAFVFHYGEISFAGAKAELDRHNARRLVSRYSSYLDDNRAFEHGLDAPLAVIAHRAVAQVRVSLLECDQGSWAELTADALWAHFGATKAISFVDESPDVMVLVGTPRLEKLAELLAIPAHLLWFPGDPAHLDGRPLSGSHQGAQSRRAAGALLAQSATACVGSEDEARRITRHLGPLRHQLLAPLDFGRVPFVVEPHSAWVMPSPSCSPVELAALLERWAAVGPANSQLELACPADRLPAGWRNGLSELRVSLKTIDRGSLATWLRSADGVVVPAERLESSPEARLARSGGLPVIAITRGMEFADATPREASARVDWGRLLRDICAGAHPPTVGRRLAADVVAALGRSSSSTL